MLRPLGVVAVLIAEHGAIGAPSDWIIGMLDAHATAVTDAIDLACGSGRHALWLATLGWQVTAVDRNSDLAGALQAAGVRFQCLDLEGPEWPLQDAQADLVVVSNYLYRPRLAEIGALVRPGGLLIYETFGVGNAAYGKPSNPDFLLAPGELTAVFASTFEPLDSFDGLVSVPKPAVRGRYCGRRHG